MTRIDASRLHRATTKTTTIPSASSRDEDNNNSVGFIERRGQQQFRRLHQVPTRTTKFRRLHRATRTATIPSASSSDEDNQLPSASSRDEDNNNSVGLIKRRGQQQFRRLHRAPTRTATIPSASSSDEDIIALTALLLLFPPSAPSTDKD